MRRFPLIVGLGLAMAFGACATISVQYDYDTEIDFSGLRTFNWMEVPVGTGIRPLALKRIRRAVEDRLTAQGYSREMLKPDFLIAVHITKERRVEIHQWGYHYGPRVRYWGGFWGPGRIDVYEYDVGTLVLDFVETESKDLMWRGIATGGMEYYREPKERAEKIRETVDRILETFPPR